MKITDKEQLSRRHHFVPQFVIKHFCNEKGFVYVYDKQTGKIEERFPKQIFFAWDRNTTEINGTKIDGLEKIYSELDSQFSPMYNRIVQDTKPSDDDIVQLLIFIQSTMWRLPANDGAFEKAANDLSLEDLQVDIRIKANSNETPDPKIIEEIKSSPSFKQAKRLMLPVLPLKDEDHMLGVITKYFINHNSYPKPALLGDMPFIIKSLEIGEFSEIIFPMSSTSTFIYKKTAVQKQVAKVLFYMNRDLVMFHQAQRYIACADKSYLETIAGIYNQIITDRLFSIDTIQASAFEFII